MAFFRDTVLELENSVVTHKKQRFKPKSVKCTGNRKRNRKQEISLDCEA